jgi:hypothetical protein
MLFPEEATFFSITSGGGFELPEPPIQIGTKDLSLSETRPDRKYDYSLPSNAWSFTSAHPLRPNDV